MHHYLAIQDLVSLIDEPIRSGFIKLLSENNDLFKESWGSTNNHQAWPGGYLDHVKEVMNIANNLYDHLSSLRPLPFSKSDALIVTFAHDLEKPWKYENGPDGRLQHKRSFRSKKDQNDFRMDKLEEYGIALTEEQKNAIKYAEGENDDYTNQRRTMGPLAAFCHICDVASARLWFDYPLEKNDTWPGAGRSFTQ